MKFETETEVPQRFEIRCVLKAPEHSGEIPSDVCEVVDSVADVKFGVADGSADLTRNVVVAERWESPGSDVSMVIVVRAGRVGLVVIVSDIGRVTTEVHQTIKGVHQAVQVVVFRPSGSLKQSQLRLDRFADLGS